MLKNRAEQTPRIAIDGAQSTGKTTLYETLQSHFEHSIHFIPEAAREIAPNFGVTCSSDWKYLIANKYLLKSFFEQELKWQLRKQQSAPRSFICDSSIYLIETYYRVFHGSQFRVEFPRCNYTLILYCSVDAEYIDDGFRFHEKRQQVAATYLRIVELKHQGSMIKLPNGKTRVEAAINEIEHHIDDIFALPA